MSLFFFSGVSFSYHMESLKYAEQYYMFLCKSIKTYI